MLESHRRLYNECLFERKSAWETNQKSVKYTEQSSWYKKARKTNSYYARLNFSSAQGTMGRLDTAFQNFFRRLKQGEKPGYPRFQAKGRFSSISFPSHGDGIKLKSLGRKLYVQHVGLIRVKLHRPIEGQIKTLSVKQEGSKWYLVVTCDLGPIEVPKHQGPSVGIDVGLEHFLTTSKGDHVANPRFLKQELPALRRAQRAVARKKKGGSNREKAKRAVRRLNGKITNQRQEFHYKTAKSITDTYSLIAMEGLNIDHMLKNHRFARSISDAGWYNFRKILTHLAEKAGAQVVVVDPSGTSQECSGCKTIVSKDLNVRWHDCSNCGLSLHRDHNSGITIENRALETLARMELAGPNQGVLPDVPRSRLLQ